MLGNYTITANTALFTITKASLTVTADNKSKVYGAALPAFTAGYGGFVFGETPAVLGGALSFSTPATASSAVGTYAITPSGLTSANYAITFVNGTLSVTPAPLTVTADNKTKILNAPLPTLTAGYSGFVLGEGPGALQGTLTLTTPATASSPVGTYTITPSGLTSQNYTITFVAGSLAIIYAPAGTACLGEPGHGILPPVRADGASVFEQGSTVPAKFRACDANGLSIATPGVVSSFRLIQMVSGTVADVVDLSVDSTTPDAFFRWDPSAQQWIFNISTKNLTANITYFYRITLNDGSVIDFRYGLK